jgi:hypothetical protein
MPPDDAMVLLGDHEPSWAAYPRSQPRQQLWTFLRLTVLHQIWGTRFKVLTPEQSTPAAVIKRCICDIVDTMQRLFYRSARRQHLIEHLPLHLLSEAILDTSMEGFLRIWCDGDTLCSVVQSPVDGKPRLHVRLSEFSPVLVAGLGVGASV